MMRTAARRSACATTKTRPLPDSGKALQDLLSDVISIKDLNTADLAVDDIQDEHTVGRF